MQITPRDSIVEVVHKLFIYTDEQNWDKLQSDVFTDEVYLDMSSLGQPATNTTAKEICQAWKMGFQGLDAINHLAGNLLVKVQGDQADVFAYATATHYKKDAVQGKTREFVGTYDLHLIQTTNGWRIDRFKYNLKYMTGNLDMS